MKHRFRKHIFKAKAVLCMALIANAQLWIGGCGASMVSGGLGLPDDGWWVRIALDDGHPLKDALRSSSFAGPIAIDIHPATNAFRLVYPDEAQRVSGTYAFVDGAFTVKEFAFNSVGQWVTMQLDDFKHVTDISTSDGTYWQRPKAWSDRVVNVESEGVQAYLDANAELVAIAGRMDRESGLVVTDPPTVPGSPSDGGQPGSGSSSPAGTPPAGDKPHAALVDVMDMLSMALQGLAAVWAFTGLVQTLVGMSAAAVAIQGLLAARFDGTWEATDEAGIVHWMVTVEGGRIVGITDDATNLQMQVVSSQLESVSEGEVVWTVVARMPTANASEAEYRFNLEEQEDGTLVGTLTSTVESSVDIDISMSAQEEET